jgi:hypothetical protein
MDRCGVWVSTTPTTERLQVGSGVQAPGETRFNTNSNARRAPAICAASYTGTGYGQGDVDCDHKHELLSVAALPY